MWHRALVDLLDGVKRSRADELPWQVNNAVKPLGLDITIYLIDLEQRALHALPEPGKPTPDPIEVNGTLAGRAFTTVSSLRSPDGSHFWIAVIDGSERLGVANINCVEEIADGADFLHQCEAFIGLVGHLIATKMPYGDLLHRVRRTRPMSPAGELLLAMLPPLTFSCSQLVVSAILEPAYDVGGDAFDYALDGSVARFFVLDAMGRGLNAALTSATALAAIRSARRRGDGLAAMAHDAHAAVQSQFPDLRFATGILSELDMDSGVLRYINAGHPPPILLRSGKAIKELSGGGRTPFGLFDADGGPEASETMQPGDRLLLYTDGVVEARGSDGEIFGLDRLIELAERHTQGELPAPEALRRLSHNIIAHQPGPPADDATLMLVEWSTQAAERMIP